MSSGGQPNSSRDAATMCGGYLSVPFFAQTACHNLSYGFRSGLSYWMIKGNCISILCSACSIRACMGAWARVERQGLPRNPCGTRLYIFFFAAIPVGNNSLGKRCRKGRIGCCLPDWVPPSRIHHQAKSSVPVWHHTLMIPFRRVDQSKRDTFLDTFDTFERRGVL